MEIVNDETLPGIIESEIARSIGHWEGTLSEARTREFQYYYGMPFGNEVEGESQVVSTDVADTVEGILPIILEIFTKSDDVVRFDPNGPEDEEQAAQQTEVANYVFYRQNNGFLVLYQWFKDALIQKNGIVKYWWEEKESNTRETYEGLTEGEYLKLMNGSYVELEEVKHEKYDDPIALQKQKDAIAQVESQPLPEDAKAVLRAQVEGAPIPQLHDVEVRVKRDESKLCIEAIPPEEFGISSAHNCVSIQDTPFCYHRTKKSVSDLREMGCPEEILAEVAPVNEPDVTPESIARDRYIDFTNRLGTGPDQVETEVWVTDCYIRIDYDGDGIAELRHIIMPGRRIWVNEECDHINFAALTPIIMPHRWIGRSVAELVMDIQFTKSVLWRQMLNNLYLTNNPRKAVLASSSGMVQANLDDLLTSRPGGIIREYVQNAVRNEEIPFVAGAAFPMLEYMDALKETRTGVTRYNQGTDADTLNKTARGIQMIQAAGQQRTALIARIFAETGVKDLMRGIVYMLSKYSSKAMTLKLRNKWVDVDPREWKTQYNMTVNVGLGTGNRDVQLAHLQTIHAQQIELMKTGRGYMVSDENVYNLYRKMQETMGFKHPELFIADPMTVPPKAKQQPPNPDYIKIQAEAQEAQAKLQQADRKMTVDAKLTEMVEQIKAQAAITVAEIQAAAQKEIAGMKIQADAQLAVFQTQAKGAMEAAGASREAKDRETELQVKELGLAFKEKILSLKSEGDPTIKQAEIEAAEGGEAPVKETLAAAFNNLASALLQGSQAQIEAARTNAQAVIEAGAREAAMISEALRLAVGPQSLSFDSVNTDKDGKITGATIVKRPLN